MKHLVHHIKKLRSTTRILFTLFCARTFGKYEMTYHVGDMEYARYRWKGRPWAFPLTPIKEEEEDILQLLDKLASS